VHWRGETAAPGTPEDLLALRDSLGRACYDGDQVLFDRSEAIPGTFQGRPAIHLRGVYQNRRHGYGGPFRAIAFIRGGRFYLLDAAVYNPAGRKLPYLREVLALAQTFHTEERP
jgi:hypothetical protein